MIDAKITFAWLRQVEADKAILHSAFRLAFIISQKINKRSGKAWPTQETLANAVGASDRMVRKLVEQLVSQGHLEVTGSGGFRKANSYQMVIKTRNSTSGFEGNKAEPQFQVSGSKRG